MMIYLAIVVLLGYTLMMIRKIGRVPDSLSASVFWLPYSSRWIWSVVLFLVCFLCIGRYIDITSENTRFLAFLSIAGLGFVGAAPLVKFSDDKMQFRVHEYGAILCAACSQLVLAFNCPFLLACWVPFIVAGFVIGWRKWDTIVFWGEMVCFASTFAYCII